MIIIIDRAKNNGMIYLNKVSRIIFYKCFLRVRRNLQLNKFLILKKLITYLKLNRMIRMRNKILL